jgi:hypothetical protein
VQFRGSWTRKKQSNEPKCPSGFGSDVKDRDEIITPIHIDDDRLSLLAFKALKRRPFFGQYVMGASQTLSRRMPAAPRRMAVRPGGA